MSYTSFFHGIAFVEGSVPDATIVSESVEVSPGSLYAHMKTLDDVKDAFVQKCTRRGANAVVNFTYGQKSKFWSFDGVKFFGKGDLVNLSQEQLTELRERYK